MSNGTQPVQAADVNKKWDMCFGNASTNPFTPAREMAAHHCSVIQLALLCMRRRRERQTIVEVGVWQAQLSRWILNALPNATLHMVDPWKAAQPGDSWYDNGDRFAKCPQEQFDAYHGLAMNLASQFNRGLEKPRAIVHRQPSAEAVKLFRNGELDVVFIDGAHDKDNVLANIREWYPKVRPGGYLSGHDYRKGGNYFGCVAAIEQATKEFSLELEVLPGKVWACRIPIDGAASDESAQPAEWAQWRIR